MPPPIAPPVAAPALPTEVKTQSQQTETPMPVDAVLLDLLSRCGVTDSRAAERVSSNDLSGIPESAYPAIARWYADACGLNSQQVSVFRGKAGTLVYIKASGVYEYARGKYQSVTAGLPTLFGTSTVLVTARVVLKDGSTVETFAARRADGPESLMACATAASVRALRVAFGIPIPSEGEL